MEENYSGCYKSLADYAEELTEDTSQIPENLVWYIDYERMGRDMELRAPAKNALFPRLRRQLRARILRYHIHCGSARGASLHSRKHYYF